MKDIANKIGEILESCEIRLATKPRPFEKLLALLYDIQINRNLNELPKRLCTIMGNAESAPTEEVHVDRRSLYEQRSLVSIEDGSDDDPLYSGDDWDHNMKIVPSSDENTAPNQEFLPPSVGLKRETLSSPTRTQSPQRVARRDPEEDPYFDEIDNCSRSRDESSYEGYDDVESDDDDDDDDDDADDDE